MLDDLKGLLSGVNKDNQTSASGQWVNGKWVPNATEQQPVQQVQQYQQQPMQQYQQQPMQQYQQKPMQQYQQQPMQQYQQPQPVQQSSGLVCPKCKSNNVSVQLIEVGSSSKTKKSGVGLGGHAHNAMRGVAAISTLGMSNLVIKKATGTEKSKGKTKNKPFGVCQNCGNTWEVKK